MGKFIIEEKTSKFHVAFWNTSLTNLMLPKCLRTNLKILVGQYEPYSMGHKIYVLPVRWTFCYLDRVAGKNLLLFVESKSSISKMWNLRDVKNADSDRMLDVLLVINSRISSFYKMLR